MLHCSLFRQKASSSANTSEQKKKIGKRNIYIFFEQKIYLLYEQIHGKAMGKLSISFLI